MSAVQRLFHIPELLEIILLELHPQDLLSHQLVSRSFKDTILQSSKLQQRLFFLQNPSPTRDPGNRPVTNPFLWKAIRRFCKIRIEISDYASCENPKHARPHRTAYCGSIEVKDFLAETMKRKQMERWILRESWQEMYLTNRALDIAIEVDSEDDEDLQLPHDAKICDLVDGVRTLYEEGKIG